MGEAAGVCVRFNSVAWGIERFEQWLAAHVQ
jgi:hypothetical protein